MHLKVGLLTGALVSSFAFLAAADPPQPSASGYWQVIDDKSGKPHGVIHVYVQDGKLNGALARLPADAPPDRTTCTKCPPPQKDKPLLGLVIMWGLKPEGSEWTGGKILDPENGSTYKCKVKLVGSDKLEVRGYVGLSMFGRTQTWVRTQEVPATPQKH